MCLLGRRISALVGASLMVATAPGAQPVAPAERPESVAPATSSGGASGGAGDRECTDSEAVEVAKIVQARYDAIEDLSASFQQTSQSAVLGGAGLAEAESTRGKVVFAKPGRMRWAYEEPEPSLVVSDGEILWIYDVGEQQASRLPVAGGYLAGAALEFLLGEGELLETFRVGALGCTDEAIEIDLLPRAPATYERLGLKAKRADGLIVETTIVDLFGTRTRIRFEDIRFDVSPPQSTFRFEPPEGVEVIDLSTQ